jgi:CubicO group peptidase (beta-lactamase class C family)
MLPQLKSEDSLMLAIQEWTDEASSDVTLSVFRSKRERCQMKKQQMMFNIDFVHHVVYSYSRLVEPLALAITRWRMQFYCVVHSTRSMLARRMKDEMPQKALCSRHVNAKGVSSAIAEKRVPLFLIVAALLSLLAVAAAAQASKPQKSIPAAKVEPAVPQVSQAHEMTAADVEAFLDGLMPMQLQREDIAGAVVVIVKDGQVFFRKGYGFADVKARVPVSADSTLFRPGSISKTFTWTAVMQLVEQDKIKLDEDVNQYLDFQIPHTFGRPVTMRNLMTHTPGFEEVIKDLMVDHASEFPSLQSFVIAHQPNQIYPPGTIPAYSNYGADLAGYIVQRVSGMPFEEYIQQNMFRPLGIKHGTYLQPLPEPLKSMMSQGYAVASEDAKPFELVPPNPAPDGSLSITGADMAPFMIAHLQHGKYGDVQILQPQTADMMHARQFSADPATNGMALGFYEESRNGLRIIGHGGDLNYFHSDMHLILEKNLGFFVSYNSAGKGELDVRTALWTEFLNRYFPTLGGSEQAAQTTNSPSVQGKYLSSRRAETTILRALWWVLAEASVTQNADGTVEVDSIKDFSGQPKRWRSLGNGQFRESHGDQLLVFKPDASGNLELVTEDPVEIFQRVPWDRNKTFVSFSLGFAVLIFALTIIFWPIVALVRKHYGRKLELAPGQNRLRLLIKLTCALDVVALLAFAASMAYGFSNLSFFSDHSDPWFRFLQLLFVAGFILTLIMIYGSFQLWRKTHKSWWSTTYAAALILSSIIFIWFTAASKIVQASLKY